MLNKFKGLTKMNLFQYKLKLVLILSLSGLIVAPLHICASLSLNEDPLPAERILLDQTVIVPGVRFNVYLVNLRIGLEYQITLSSMDSVLETKSLTFASNGPLVNYTWSVVLKTDDYDQVFLRLYKSGLETVLDTEVIDVLQNPGLPIEYFIPLIIFLSVLGTATLALNKLQQASCSCDTKNKNCPKCLTVPIQGDHYCHVCGTKLKW